jgi:hypothetical protein
MTTYYVKTGVARSPEILPALHKSHALSYAQHNYDVLNQPLSHIFIDPIHLMLNTADGRILYCTGAPRLLSSYFKRCINHCLKYT